MIETYHVAETISRRPVRVLHPAIDRDILTRLANGKTRKEIAHDLGMSHQWVSAHVCRMKEECGARTEAELVAQAFRRGALQ